MLVDTPDGAVLSPSVDAMEGEAGSRCVGISFWSGVWRVVCPGGLGQGTRESGNCAWMGRHKQQGTMVSHGATSGLGGAMMLFCAQG